METLMAQATCENLRFENLLFDSNVIHINGDHW